MRETYLQQSIRLLEKKAFDRAKNSNKSAQKVHYEINKLYPTSHSFRAAAVMLVDNYFSRAIELAIVGQLPSSFIEMHSLVEFASIQLFCKNMKIKANQQIVRQLLNRKTLKDMYPYYVELGVWTTHDGAFVKRLANIRNGIAHRNLLTLAKHLGVTSSQSSDHYENLNFQESECFESLAKSIDLCVKLFKQPRKKSRT